MLPYEASPLWSENLVMTYPRIEAVDVRREAHASCDHCLRVTNEDEGTRWSVQTVEQTTVRYYSPDL